jgi:hypothetical protein
MIIIIKPLLVTSWYRPPDSGVDKFNYFETPIGKLDVENVEYYVMGEMKCNLRLITTLNHNSLTLLNNIFIIYVN